MIGRSPKLGRTRAGARTLLATTALGAALCALGAGPTLAATAQEGENLRRDIEAFLNDPGYPEYSFENGPVTVEVVDDGYNFVIPDLVLIFDQNPSQVTYGDPAHLEVSLDTLHLRVVPDPVDQTSYALDARFGSGSLFGAGGAVRFVIEGGDNRAFVDIGKNGLTGTWSTNIGYVTDAELVIENIVAIPDPEGLGAPDARVSIGLIRGASDMTEVQPGLWDGSGETVVENVVVEADGEVPFRLGQMTFHQTVGGFAFDDYMEWVRTSPIMMGEEMDFASEAEAQSFFKQQILDFPTVLDDFGMGWTLTDLDAGEAGDRVLIERHEFEIGATGLAGDLSDWTIRVFAQGMSMPAPELPAQFVPTVFDLNLSFNGVPTGLGWQAMENAVEGSEVRDMDQIGPMLGQEMLQLALQSQTGMDLSGEIDWETGNVQFTGHIEADPQSPVMASGGLNVVVGEMQAFIREVESTVGAEPAGVLTMFQALGQQEGDNTVYDFQISGSSILMNGQDMQPLMMMLGQ